MSVRDEAIEEILNSNPNASAQIVVNEIIRGYESAMLARGQKMMAREPTEDMLKAISGAIVDPKTHRMLRVDAMKYDEAWGIMWDAAPSPGDAE